MSNDNKVYTPIQSTSIIQKGQQSSIYPAQSTRPSSPSVASVGVKKEDATHVNGSKVMQGSANGKVNGVGAGAGGAGVGSEGKGVREVTNPEWTWYSAGMKRKRIAMGFEPSHLERLERVGLGYELALLEDQCTVLHPPSKPSKFKSTEDAIERLLPYHIFQIHNSELDGQELPPKEQEQRDKKELKDAMSLNEKIEKIHERFFKLKYREGTHPSHLPSLVNLLQQSIFSTRDDLTIVQAQYRRAQSTYSEIQMDRITRERKEAQAQAANAALASKIRHEHLVGQNKAAAAAAAAAVPSSSSSSSSSVRKPTTAITTPVRTPQAQIPAAIPASTSSNATPSVNRVNPSSPAVNGTPAPRPRGRPPKAKEDGLRESVLKGTPAGTSSNPPQTPKTATTSSAITTPSTSAPPATPTNATPANASSPANATPANAATPANSTTAKAVKKTVVVSVPMVQLKRFIDLDLIALPPDPANPKPATVMKHLVEQDKVIVMIDLPKCNPQQLRLLADMIATKEKATTTTGGGTAAAEASNNARKEGSAGATSTSTSSSARTESKIPGDNAEANNK